MEAPPIVKRVYIETTIPSYLAAQPARDLLQAARQQLTRDWWEFDRERYELCTSEVVLDEAHACNSEFARLRMEYLVEIPVLTMADAAKNLAKSIMSANVLPQRATRDAFHIAIATAHGVDFLLTWNCRHIANPSIIRQLQKIAGSLDLELPVLCTPEGLRGE